MKDHKDLKLAWLAPSGEHHFENLQKESHILENHIRRIKVRWMHGKNWIKKLSWNCIDRFTWWSFEVIRGHGFWCTIRLIHSLRMFDFVFTDVTPYRVHWPWKNDFQTIRKQHIYCCYRKGHEISSKGSLLIEQFSLLCEPV